MTNHIIRIRRYERGEEQVFEFPMPTNGDPDPFDDLHRHAQTARNAIQMCYPASTVTISAIDTYSTHAPQEPRMNGDTLSAMVLAAKAVDDALPGVVSSMSDSTVLSHKKKAKTDECSMDFRTPGLLRFYCRIATDSDQYRNNHIRSTRWSLYARQTCVRVVVLSRCEFCRSIQSDHRNDAAFT